MWTIFYSELLWMVLGVAAIFFGLGRLPFLRKKRGARLYVSGAALAAVVGCILLGYGVRHYPVDTAAQLQYTQQALLQDFDRLQQAICTENPLAFGDRIQLTEQFKAVRNQITGSMTQEAFYRLVNPLVAATQCGHTNLSVSPALIAQRKQTAVFFPLAVQIKEEAIRIAVPNAQYGVAEGDRIVSINGKTAAEIIAVFRKNISHDGAHFALTDAIASKHFAYEYFEFVEQPNTFTVELVDGAEKPYSIQVEGQYIPASNTAAWQLHVEEFAGVAPYEYAIEGDTATLAMRVFFEGQPKFAAFLAEFFQTIQEQGINQLVIDLQGNFGGSPQLSRELLSYLVAEPTPYFTKDTKLPWLYRLQGMGKDIAPKENRYTGQTTLQIDGGVFSTAGHFAAAFQANNLGQVVGSPTGGGAVCTDGATNIVLKNTGLRLHNSRTYYAVVAGDGRKNSVLPD